MRVYKPTGARKHGEYAVNPPVESNHAKAHVIDGTVHIGKMASPTSGGTSGVRKLQLRASGNWSMDCTHRMISKNPPGKADRLTSLGVAKTRGGNRPWQYSCASSATTGRKTW